jgi:hypothetical protein
MARTSKPAPAADTGAPRLATLAEFRPDPHNARRRTPRSHGMLERSLSEFGAARSIVVDEEGVVLAGNGTIEAAASVGIERVLVVPCDGNTLVAVQRTDLDPTQKRSYSLADNRASDTSKFDGQALAALMELDPELDVSPWFTPEEIAALEETVEVPEGPGDPGGGEEATVTLKFPDQETQNLFLQSLMQLAALMPNPATTEARLQLVLDNYISCNNS